MKNSSDTIGNRTRGLSACSAVPQSTALPRVPTGCGGSLKIHCIFRNRRPVILILSQLNPVITFTINYNKAFLYFIPYILTPWYRVLLEKLTGMQLVKKFPPFHGTRRFITALTSVRHLSISWASPIQSIYPHPTSWRSILILSAHLRLGLLSGSFPPVSPPRPYTPPVLTHTCHMPSPSHSSHLPYQ